MGESRWCHTRITIDNQDFVVMGRTERVIQYLIKHKERINGDTKGSIELHYSDRSLTGKVETGPEAIE